MRKRKRRKKVFCAGCANLFILGGENPPMCVATASFVVGPLRGKIDVQGVESAIVRNIHNDCEYKTFVSLRAYELKRWILWRLNNGVKKQIGEVDLRDYSVKKEYDRKRAVLHSGEEESAGEEEGRAEVDQESIDTEEDYQESAGEEEGCSETGEEEGVLSDGGIDDHDEPSADSEVGAKDVQDT